MMRTHSIRSRGMALFLVMISVAIATVLAAALLANSGLQSQVGSNMVQATRADTLAESGLNLACYYLSHPNQAPSSAMSGLKYYLGETNISLGPTSSTSNGTVTLSVTQQTPAGDVYTVSSAATAPAPGNSACTLSAQVQANYAGVVNALTSNAALNFGGNTNINGNVLVNGTLSTSTGAVINGTAIATIAGSSKGTVQGSGGIGQNTILTTAAGGVNVPTATSVQDYRKYLYYSALTGWKLYTAPDLSTAAPGYQIGTLNLVIATLTNPGGVYVSNQSVTLNNGATIQGTLIIQNGNLIVKGNNVTATPQGNGVSGQKYPAIIVMNGNVVVSADSAKLVVNGMLYVNGSVVTDGPSHGGAQLIVNGAVAFGGSSASITSTIKGFNVSYNSGNVNCPHFNTQADSVTITKWQQ